MRLALLAPLIAGLVAFPVGAQDCNLAAKRWDNPLSYSGGFQMRRYQWHAVNVGLSTLAGEALHRTTKLPRGASALVVAGVLGFLPHSIGLALHKYPFDWRDWAFDAFTRSAPLILWTGASGGTWQSKTLAGTTLIGGYFAGACFASP